MSANNDKEEQKDYTTVLASILALPTDQLEKTMNNELSTQLSHINSEYFYFINLDFRITLLTSTLNLEKLLDYKYIKTNLLNSL